MAGAEEIQVWVERSEVLDMKMSFGSSFIKEKKNREVCMGVGVFYK